MVFTMELEPVQTAKGVTIQRVLRERIVTGELVPGSRLPTREELQRRFGVSRETIDRVMRPLAEDGFVKGRGRGGTFVADHPPHLNTIGIVFPYTKQSVRFYSRLYRALEMAAAEGAVGPFPRRTRSYSADEGRIDRPGFRELNADAAAHRMAGLVFTFDVAPVLPRDIPVLKDPAVPRVGLSRVPPGWSQVQMDMSSFTERALRFLAQRGRKRLGVMAIFDREAVRWIEQAAGRGFEVRPHWVQQGAPNYPGSTRRAMHLLGHLPADDRPDALIVTDDNLVEEAAEGLAAAGIRVPEEMLVVGHANFPAAPSPVLPVQLIGFDCSQALRLAADQIIAIRTGKAPGQSEQIQAIFEEEWRMRRDDAASTV